MPSSSCFDAVHTRAATKAAVWGFQYSVASSPSPNHLIRLGLPQCGMAEPQIVNTLAAKIETVERYTAEIKKRVQAARHDLAHLQATLRLFRRDDDTGPVYIGLTRIFRRGEITGLSLAALRGSPVGLDTRELARAVMEAKGLDT